MRRPRYEIIRSDWKDGSFSYDVRRLGFFSSPRIAHGGFRSIEAARAWIRETIEGDKWPKRAVVEVYPPEVAR